MRSSYDNLDKSAQEASTDSDFDKVLRDVDEKMNEYNILKKDRTENIDKLQGKIKIIKQ